MSVLLVLLVIATGCRGGDPEVSLAGLWPYDPEQGYHDALIIGVLVIEEPCVYVEPTTGGEIERTSEGEPVRAFVMLPEAFTRYDPDTNQVWVDDDGPMTTGDEVMLGGGISGGDSTSIKKTHEGVCVAHGRVVASSMNLCRDLPERERRWCYE